MKFEKNVVCVCYSWTNTVRDKTPQTSLYVDKGERRNKEERKV